MRLPFKALFDDSDDLRYREGNCQDGVKTGIAVYINELSENEFLLV
jgi:hypothetical protein